ncbi:hypothetical protein ACFL6R_07160 [Gemmatimonadota bacterium]
MPTTTRMDKELGIRFHIVSGVADPDNIRSELAAPDFDPTMPALWDIRRATGNLTGTQIRELAQSVGSLWREQRPPRIALLVASGLQYGLARMYEQYIDLTRKMEMRVFKVEEEALEWLTSSRSPPVPPVP